ncbi:reductase [Thermobispora bispora]|jgi:2'-hydroxyisoflavone reductase|uniref:NAD-dependent epimerase/dehydratase n=1 Tax=Thermobispora bispora (strain ATCC 19993 / DSM 43833 / CBS 139.67 / JCM 10125 / KCTC 9307 / NBRC 14880 / R51) TaxID=469371 RepID=D6Y3R6_THEBD|nr:NAD-dependent epimerase [Thermobispora bispora]MBO2474627.1 NAD-dependent epimerase [Actinomycetales bacterium]MDI9580218.1 NAD-dependent epimerase [Thermobispora sp.]ADG89018.1 NAD-dependent epimerase/dehydratase [Thermobispora bispora DSM 43833]MBX6168203.1 NAD-dependent epimerase [Thermobispora bispora]QSI48746.1 NAD-dependent epimerase [Thermobispora bispora]
MRLLIIGGGIFLGRAIVAEALARGHRVTTFNRGRTGVDLPGTTIIRGDREVPADLDRLAAAGPWDAVIDVCGYTPRIVLESVRRLSGRAGHYTFISSVSAYRDWPMTPGIDESSPRFDCPPDAGEEYGEYGVLKAGCERAVEEHFRGATLVIRPGLIVGPNDNIGRLPWWLTRIARGGRVLAPGDPDRPLQLIDARDIAAFTVDQVERGTAGRFLTGGVPGNTTFGGLLADCLEITGSGAEPVWVDDGFLLDHDVRPWTELPLWLPEAQGPGVWTHSSAKALAAGLTCRPVRESVRDTWAWLKDIPEERRGFGPPWLRHGIDPDKEARILAAWDARS